LTSASASALQTTSSLVVTNAANPAITTPTAITMAATSYLSNATNAKRHTMGVAVKRVYMNINFQSKNNAHYVPDEKMIRRFLINRRNFYYREAVFNFFYPQKFISNFYDFMSSDEELQRECFSGKECTV
jgi:hypothetical protein